MKLFDLLIMANSSLWHNKLRTFLTVLAIFIGATTLSLTNGIGSGVKSYINSQISNLGNPYSLTITANKKSAHKFGVGSSNGLTIYNPNQRKILGSFGQSSVALTNHDIAKIASIKNIKLVDPVYSISPDYIQHAGSQKYSFLLAQSFGNLKLDLVRGQNVNNNINQPQITIPVNDISNLDLGSSSQAIGQKVQIAISNNLGQKSVFSATIVGIQQTTLIGSTQIYVNNYLATQLQNYQQEGLPTYSQNVYKSLEAIYPANLSTKQLNQLISTLNQDGYKAQTIQNRVQTVFTVINSATDVLDFFAIITLVAASFGIINTLLMSVQERTREIGLMKALGLSRSKIFTLFSIEAALIGFWGSFLGILFANLIGSIVNKIVSNGFLKSFPGLNLFTFPAQSSIIIIIVIIVVAFLAGTLPARRAANKDAIEALRYE